MPAVIQTPDLPLHDAVRCGAVWSFDLCRTVRKVFLTLSTRSSTRFRAITGPMILPLNLSHLELTEFHRKLIHLWLSGRFLTISNKFNRFHSLIYRTKFINTDEKINFINQMRNSHRVTEGNSEISALGRFICVLSHVEIEFWMRKLEFFRRFKFLKWNENWLI